MSYLTLRSNSSMGYYPDNNASHFFTRLPQPIEVNGEYEVGLSEIMFDNTQKYIKVGENQCKLIFRANRQRQTGVEYLPEGSYGAGEQLADALNGVMDPYFTEETTTEAIRFKYNGRRMMIKIKKPGGYVKLSGDLQRLLGFDRPVFGTGPDQELSETGSENVGEAPRAVYVYSDIVRPRPVGDALVPLLRIVPPGKRSRDVIHHVFEKPNYIPLSRFRFDTIEILLTDDAGQKVAFGKEKSIVTLHLRRRRLE